MFDALHIIAYCNLSITVLYFVIAYLVGSGLWAERARGFNPLGVATFGIFLSCGLHHGIHGDHALASAQLYGADPDLWQQLASDIFLLIPAIAFLSLRRRYGLLARGEGVILDYEKLVTAQKREKVAITDAMLDALFTLDGEGNVLSVNPYAAGLLHYSAAEMYGRPFSHFVTNPAALEEGLKKVASADLQGYEVAMRTSTGEPILSALNARSVRNADGSTYMTIIVARDIREQKAMESELRNYSERLEALVQARTSELEEANKELDSFAYSISHDLRAPLRAIAGFSQAIFDDYADRLDDTGINYLNRVQMGVKRMSTLIEDLLTFSRLTRREFDVTRVDPNELVRDVLVYFEADIAERKVEVTVARLPLVPCDPGVLSEVFQNLIGNALKYTRDTPHPKIEVGVEQRQSEYLFNVRDNGIGFDQAYHDKIWQAFQRLHTQEEYEGTGIGLAIVRRVVERHGGKTWADSKEGQGATFFFTIPLEPPRREDDALLWPDVRKEQPHGKALQFIPATQH